MTSKLSPKPRGARKPETVLRELENIEAFTTFMHHPPDEHGNPRPLTSIQCLPADKVRQLLSELRRSLPSERGAGKR